MSQKSVTAQIEDLARQYTDARGEAATQILHSVSQLNDPKNDKVMTQFCSAIKYYGMTDHDIKIANGYIKQASQRVGVGMAQHPKDSASVAASSGALAADSNKQFLDAVEALSAKYGGGRKATTTQQPQQISSKSTPQNQRRIDRTSRGVPI